MTKALLEKENTISNGVALTLMEERTAVQKEPIEEVFFCCIGVYLHR
jgi:hypothetical protein